MRAERATCARVQGLLRGAPTPSALDVAAAAHLDRCPDCRSARDEYRHLAGALRALRDQRAPADPTLVDSIARRVDAEIGRRLRRTWAVATVAGGLAVAGAAGVVTHALRGRVVMAAPSG